MSRKISGRRALLILGAWPALLAVATGVATGAPGQPGVAAPGAGQPGASVSPAAPVSPVVPDTSTSPQLVDYVPEPATVLPVPSRPRPQQQVQPQQNTVPQQNIQPQQNIAPQRNVQPQTVTNDWVEDTEPEVEAVPAAIPVDPHTLRLGNGTVSLPDPIDVRTRDKVQAYADLAEWNLAAVGDSMGLPRTESDRMAAGALGGGLIGAPVAAAVAAPFGAVGGCGVGAVIGAVAGGLIGGIPTAGAMAVPGALIGGAIGCGIGGATGGVGAAAVGGVAGGLAGAGTGAVIGGADRDVALPGEVPPLMEAPAPEPVPAPAPIAEPSPVYEAAAPYVEPAPIAEQFIPVAEVVTEQVITVAEQVAAVDPNLGAAVESFTDAVAELPPVDPAQFGAWANPINDVLAAVQAELGN